MSDTFRRTDPNTVPRASRRICICRTCTYRVPNIFRHHLAECTLRSMRDTCNRRASNRVCKCTRHIRRCPSLGRRTARLGLFHTRNYRIDKIRPKSLPPDWVVCRIRTRRTRTALCHCNPTASCCLDDIPDSVPIPRAHQCCKKNDAKFKH